MIPWRDFSQGQQCFYLLQDSSSSSVMMLRHCWVVAHFRWDVMDLRGDGLCLLVGQTKGSISPQVGVIGIGAGHRLLGNTEVWPSGEKTGEGKEGETAEKSSQCCLHTHLSPAKLPALSRWLLNFVTILQLDSSPNSSCSSASTAEARRGRTALRRIQERSLRHQQSLLRWMGNALSLRGGSGATAPGRERAAAEPDCKAAVKVRENRAFVPSPALGGLPRACTLLSSLPLNLVFTGKCWGKAPRWGGLWSDTWIISLSLLGCSRSRFQTLVRKSRTDGCTCRHRV